MGMQPDSATAVYRRTFQERLSRQYQVREERRQKALRAILPLVPILAAAFPSVQTVYLFGSITRVGQFHQGSDIDVAVIGATAVDYFAFWRELETALSAWTIDLRDADDDSYFSQRIKETGILLYERTHPSATG